MSKIAKKSIFILMVLLLAALGFAVYSYMNLQTVESEKARIERDFVEAQAQYQTKEKLNAQKVAKLNNEIAKVNVEKNKAIQDITRIEKMAEQQAQEFSNQISKVTEDRDKWKRRIDTIKTERDKLMSKIAMLNKSLVEKDEEVSAAVAKARAAVIAATTAPEPKEEEPKVSSESGSDVDEQYWANLLQEKASLEIKIESLKDELSAKAIALVEIKQNNADLKLEVDNLKHEKEEVNAEIQMKTDMIDSISLELARTKNDKKFITNRMEKLNDENTGLRRQMKQLVSVKNALEKSIVRITQEKDKIESQLGRSEILIQSKIDEIWDIKDEIDHSIKSSQANTTNGVELPPIVVSSSDGAMSFNSGAAAPSLNGKVISVNEINNFVIVDLGENAGIRLGDSLSVYRESKYIARLEVIQVRKDIAAADLKDQWSKVQVGDLIR